MRKLLYIAAAVCMVAAASCSRHNSEMEQAAKGYLQAMGDYKLDEAIPYATRQTRENTIPTLKKVMARADTNYIKQNTPSVITIKGARMLSDTSAYVYYHKHTPIKDVDDSVTVLLEEGKWLVDVKMRPVPFLNIPDTLEPHIPVKLSSK